MTGSGRFLGLALAVGLLFGTMPSQGADTIPPSNKSAPSPDTATPALPNKVVATVDGQPITEDDVAIAEQDLGSQLQSVPEAQRHDYVISFLTDLLLGAEAGEQAKIQDTPDFPRRLAYYRKKILLDELMVRTIAKADTPQARRKLYDDTMAKTKPEVELHARHVLVADEATAKKVAALARKGDDFAALAKKYSTDGSGSEGGDLGWFTRDKMVKAFSDVAFKMEPGQISDPVHTQFGWHVIKVEGKRTKPVPTFEQVQSQISSYLARKAEQQLILSLRAKAKVVRLDAPPKAAPAPAPAPAAPTPSQPAPTPKK